MVPYQCQVKEELYPSLTQRTSLSRQLSLPQLWHLSQRVFGKLLHNIFMLVPRKKPLTKYKRASLAPQCRRMALLPHWYRSRDRLHWWCQCPHLRFQLWWHSRISRQQRPLHWEHLREWDAGLDWDLQVWSCGGYLAHAVAGTYTAWYRCEHVENLEKCGGSVEEREATPYQRVVIWDSDVVERAGSFLIEAEIYVLNHQM